MNILNSWPTKCRFVNNAFISVLDKLTILQNSIEAATQETSHGRQYILKLRVDLIGFHRVPGKHDGEHLAHAFLHILDRVSVSKKVCFSLLIFFLIHLFTFSQIGWITLDNASNNDTFLRHLKELLHECGITFDIISQRIRFVTFLIFWWSKLIDGIAASLTPLI